ncbi:MAG TPA: 30S ribosomal protein S7 [Herpetosiphon sp.]|uniref:Small ribosomal subunit protein uS7 n=1 Tax=Herpetosiphon aurantiacus (strain ATCC 23779 / DSM 785 / 114-95) TaxID=316274 RepID=RS7_HERA2|nr:30S ribosomal protein S7 [Herpetosiphon sp.]A9B745.1 RecName: Full=Small ribosomal subunit protein uS7; AltName: Full=30S ribosomal protein S7 [Herpetosiphon aurantiacus DSM 785]ABX05913.1 ribosomal protein S7 [Herpetosiphon aurantiacus DSM 785]HBW51559.1 30S ribosomal protein S7 [Herpetosiphon sp.]
MPRRRKIAKRIVPGDPIHNSIHVQMLINKVMMHGKKSVAENIVYRALDVAAQRLNREPVDLFEQVLRNSSPTIEVRPKRVGGSTYQVPVEVKSDRRIALAIRWLLTAARGRSGKPMHERLALELVDAFNNTGATVKRREEVHRMAEANRAFSHYARF